MRIFRNLQFNKIKTSPTRQFIQYLYWKRNHNQVPKTIGFLSFFSKIEKKCEKIKFFDFCEYWRDHPYNKFNYYISISDPIWIYRLFNNYSNHFLIRTSMGLKKVCYKELFGGKLLHKYHRHGIEKVFVIQEFVIERFDCVI